MARSRSRREGLSPDEVGRRPHEVADRRPFFRKIDFILVSPALVAKMTKGGIDRRGVWGGKNGDLFPHLPSITKSIEAASDHAAIWAEFNV